MLAPLSVLKKFVDFDMPVDAFVKRMIMTGTAVEGYSEVAPEVSGIVTARITAVEKHTNADSLSVCQADIGERTIQICTAATNVYPGALVPVCLNGAHLADGTKIKTTKMRGELSEGMFCSYQELGLSQEMYPTADEHGILIFNEDYPLGMDVKEIFGLNDTVIDFDILSNRSDCQCVAGVSREVAAALGKKACIPAPAVRGAGGDVHDYMSVEVRSAQLCPRFVGRMIRGVKVGPSPMWLRNALNAMGLRPINNIVDITNYMLKVYGQPMHAYDYDMLREKKIIVRNAADGELFKTLDGKERALDASMLVIADGMGTTGIAGVMGGEESEIRDCTTTVFLEAASFDFASVRVTSRKLGLRTDASAMFEKGVNPATVYDNMQRACALVEELGCGEVVDGVIDVYPEPLESKTVTAPIARLYALMGMEVPPQEMLTILASLDMDAHIDGANIVCTAPAHRRDINTTADVAEEVLRYAGFDKLPSHLMVTETVAGAIGAKHEFQYRVRDILCGAGFDEAMTYSFVSPKSLDSIRLAQDDARRNTIKITNPLGEYYSVMRTTLIPSMLTTLATNYSRSISSAAFFEIAPVFAPKQTPITELPDEAAALCLGCYGAEVDFYSLKGVVELLLDQLGIQVAWSRADEPFLHPGRSAYLSAEGETLGYIGQVHPDVCEDYKLGAAYVAQLDLRAIQARARHLSVAKMPPRYPAVSRDIALVLDDAVPAGDVLAAIVKACGKLYEEAHIFDVYRGKGLSAGKKSVAYSFTIRAADRTLTDEEVNKVFAKVLAACQTGFGAELRS